MTTQRQESLGFCQQRFRNMEMSKSVIETLDEALLVSNPFTLGTTSAELLRPRIISAFAQSESGVLLLRWPVVTSGQTETEDVAFRI
jgi:hypothetical protein